MLLLASVDGMDQVVQNSQPNSLPLEADVQGEGKHDHHKDNCMLYLMGRDLTHGAVTL